MSESHCKIKNYSPDDFDSYVRLHLEAEELDGAGYCVSSRVLRENLGRPGYSPQLDLFIAEVEGVVKGCINLTPELGIGRVIINCLVHPDHRRKGLATQLYYSALRRASSLGARVIQGSIAEGNIAARNWLSGLDFRFIRRFLELKLDLTEARLVDSPDTRFTCRHLQRREEGVLAEIQNRSFAGTWGYNAGTVEEIAYRASLSDCSPEGIILVCDAGEPAGYCWVTMRTESDASAGTRKGRIYMLGVLPEHRGRGLGRVSLLAGLFYLRSQGIGIAELTVDSENREACALYKSVGFRTYSNTLWYEKALD